MVSYPFGCKLLCFQTSIYLSRVKERYLLTLPLNSLTDVPAGGLSCDPIPEDINMQHKHVQTCQY